MKPLIFLLALFISNISFALETVPYQKAIEISQQTDQKIFVYFGAKWCHFCKEMDVVLDDEEVSNKLKDYLIVKLDLDKDIDLKKKYKVKSIPDYIIIDKTEKILKRDKGFKEKQIFIDWIEN